ncbi:bifunctional hydroxymethylpyrimidine kinase/phosphomethylpyrimidine kinase [Halopenitus persicus]|uniref:bifunctional hydroxymethylpyrimidine kinase/phosphomethylpyrimidine kinase n=1 Tax=Halopenitus persicus TaxID=1048396 RepID=UPI000BBAF6C6|nr:bifunctional hydroxymethylpyrimidine kinase/phosphomethylpyrimidine kinase [Halopenitus persicus]
MTDSDDATADSARPPVALTIAGSDSGGGAGIQADLKTMTAHDVFGTSVVTATTAQHTRGVIDVSPLPAAHVERQYAAVLEDFDVRAVKTGMLATADTVEAVTDRLGRPDMAAGTATSATSGFDGPVVVDPVLIAESGDRLLPPAAEDAYADLIAAATLVTPNADEASVLTDRDVVDVDSAAAAARDLLETGADAALVTGGHLDAGPTPGESVVDVFLAADDAKPTRIVSPRIDTAATHGSGCTLSSAIAARLARGESLEAAVEAAARGLSDAVRAAYDVGDGPGAVNPTQLDR